MIRGLKNFIKNLPFVGPFFLFLFGLYRLNSRVSYLEKRIQNHRWYAVEQVMDYLVGAQVDGDYCEFGVFKGETFAYGLKFHALFPNMRYFAFDSFEGLPAPKGIDALDGCTSNFSPGEFAFSENDFLNHLKNLRLPTDRVRTVKGWFNETLNDDTANRLGINKVAAAWIDCDLYESTVPVLSFLTNRISVGTILIFDDWYVYRNLPDRGEQRACKEWLEKNPNIQIKPIFGYAHHGQVFTVIKV